MHIDFVVLKEYHTTRAILEGRGEALRPIAWKGTVAMLHVEILLREKVIRAGYGALTILVDRRDLFGANLPDHGATSRRIYRRELSAVEEIVDRLIEITRGGQR